LKLSEEKFTDLSKDAEQVSMVLRLFFRHWQWYQISQTVCPLQLYCDHSNFEKLEVKKHKGCDCERKIVRESSVYEGERESKK
jgi:hypothetical protein